MYYTLFTRAPPIIDNNRTTSDNNVHVQLLFALARFLRGGNVGGILPWRQVRRANGGEGNTAPAHSARALSSLRPALSCDEGVFEHQRRHL